jgi:hypothetical protein
MMARLAEQNDFLAFQQADQQLTFAGTRPRRADFARRAGSEPGQDSEQQEWGYANGAQRHPTGPEPTSADEKWLYDRSDTHC